MKIKFDENISKRLVHVIRELETDKTLEIGSVAEDYSAGMTDPAWMFQFRDEGGIAMISGDHNILQKPVNSIAYGESGLISIWPPSGWPQLKLWGQAAFILRWWPVIKIKIARSTAGDRWRLPLHWTPTVDAFISIRDPRVDGSG